MDISQVEDQKTEKDSKKNKPNIKEHYTGNAIGAVFLLLLGSVFLLNNFGFLPWSMWGHIWKLWPLFLILPGLQLVLGKSKVATWIIALVGFVLVGFLLMLSLASVDSNFQNWMRSKMSYLPEKSYALFQNPSTVTDELTITEDDYDLDIIKNRSVSIDIGVSQFTLTDSSSEEYLTVDAQYYQGFGVPELTHELKGKELEISFSTESQSGFNPFWLSGNEVSYDFTIGQRNIPTDITIDLGTGKGEIALEKLNTNNLTANVGTGSLEFTLDKLTLPAEALKLDVGTGKITLTLPREVGLEIKHSIGTGVLRIDSEKVEDDGTYYSDNYNDVDSRVTIQVEVGTGAIDINLE